MSTCWKCEKELPDGQVECEDGCGRPVAPRQPTPEALRKLLRESRPLDLEKILATPESVIAFLRAWHTHAPVPPDEDKLKECYQLLLHHLLRDLSQIRIPRGSAGADKLKDWLL